MSPLVAGTEAAKSSHGCRSPRRLGLHSTMRAQASAFASMTPAQLSQYARRPFVTDILGDSLPTPADRPSCELTRRFPKRTTSRTTISHNSRACPIRYGQPADDLYRPRLDKDASSRVGPCKHCRLLCLPTPLRFLLASLLRRRQRIFACGLRIVPRFFVAQHGPAAHENLTRESDDRL